MKYLKYEREQVTFIYIEILREFVFQNKTFFKLNNSNLAANYNTQMKCYFHNTCIIFKRSLFFTITREIIISFVHSGNNNNNNHPHSVLLIFA